MSYIPNSQRTPEMVEQLRERRREYQKRFRAKNPEHSNQRRLVYMKRHPDRVIAQNRRGALRKYGLTPAAFDAMVAAQGGLCAICGRQLETGRGTHIDHSHETDLVRGLLCDCCNPMIGLAQESPEILQAAIAYLQKHGSQN